MTTFSKDEAQNAYWKASPRIRRVILEEARANAAARQVAMVALEQRVSQAVAALFAAAAFSATFGATFRGLGPHLPFLSGLATISFTVGAMVCLYGMMAGDIVFQGVSPSWWKDADFLEETNPEKAGCWNAGLLEQVIESYDDVARKRAAALNLGLKYGAAGGVLVAIAGGLMIFS